MRRHCTIKPGRMVRRCSQTTWCTRVRFFVRVAHSTRLRVWRASPKVFFLFRSRMYALRARHTLTCTRGTHNGATGRASRRRRAHRQSDTHTHTTLSPSISCHWQAKKREREREIAGAHGPAPDRSMRTQAKKKESAHRHMQAAARHADGQTHPHTDTLTRAQESRSPRERTTSLHACVLRAAKRPQAIKGAAVLLLGILVVVGSVE